MSLNTVTNFRLAKLGDTPAIVNLVNSAYRGDFSKRGWTTEADLLDGQRVDGQQVGLTIEDPQSVILIADSPTTGSINACVHLRNLQDRAYLGMLTVCPNKQSQGVGKDLLSAAELFVGQEWNKQIVEMTVINLRSELISWYERRGYRLTGEKRPFPKHDPRFGIPKLEFHFVVLTKQIT